MLWPQDLKTWTEVVLNIANILSTIITIIAVLVGALWAYTKFVIELGSFPGAQFYIELATIGALKDRKIVEFLIHLKNAGQSTLIVKNLRFDLRYLLDDADVALFDSGIGREGKLYFPNSIHNDVKKALIPLHHVAPPLKTESDAKKEEHAKGKETRGFSLIQYNTFVLPNVAQAYTFSTAVPQSTSFVLAYASFEYEIKLNELNTRVLRLSRRLGLIHYSMTHVEEAHTCERLFKIA